MRFQTKFHPFSDSRCHIDHQKTPCQPSNLGETGVVMKIMRMKIITLHLYKDGELRTSIKKSTMKNEKLRNLEATIFSPYQAKTIFVKNLFDR